MPVNNNMLLENLDSLHNRTSIDLVNNTTELLKPELQISFEIKKHVFYLKKTHLGN